MTRTHHLLIAAAVLALPAAAVAHSAFAPPPRGPCFVSGAATYQIARGVAAPDVRVKVTDIAAPADLRLRLVDRAELADFVLVDDFAAGPSQPCRSATPIRTVALDAGESAEPDVTVSLTAAPTGEPGTTIYVHSARYSQHDAAALLAAMWVSDRSRTATGSIR